MNILDQFLILGSQTQTATTTSAPFALTPGTNVMVTNESTTVAIRVAFGGAGVVATQNSCSVPPLATRTFSVRDIGTTSSSGGATFIAIIAASTTAVTNIATGEGSSTT